MRLEPIDGVTALVAAAGMTALSGQVVAADGVPLRRVIVRDGKSTATTDEQGRFLLTGVAAGISVMTLDAHHAGPDGKTEHGSTSAHADKELRDRFRILILRVPTIHKRGPRGLS